MCGEHAGVQKLIEEHYERMIPYVHCYNHRLHLMVVAVVQNVNLANYFSVNQDYYIFFQ